MRDYSKILANWVAAKFIYWALGPITSHPQTTASKSLVSIRALVTNLAALSSDSLQQLSIGFDLDFYGFPDERCREFRSSPSKIHTHTPRAGPPADGQQIPSLYLRDSRVSERRELMVVMRSELRGLWIGDSLRYLVKASQPKKLRKVSLVF
ncbi:hypothetical protein F2Q69_00033671 [Brassica cretica]|uniref:Uncharacterized protein n=1 Tax=Brassica cretica TaxID=69181 RepID=A0A8S9SSU4_BRACR|nr:hypothetical protein F2Q69_00033671 [Brassica cretica]